MQHDALERMSTLSLQDGGAPRADAERERPRIGAKGEALVQAARAVPSWVHSRTCALCEYPAQEGAARWKAARTCGAMRAGGADATDMCLEERLCYACLQVLSVPDAGDGVLPLPAYVYSALAAPVREELSASPPPPAHADDASAHADDAANPHAPDGRHGMTRSRRDDMREKVQEFLLE